MRRLFSPSKRSAPPPMDQGYSWVIMAAAFLILFIIFGQILNFGMYFVVLLDHFEASKEAVALIGGLSCSLVDLAGPIAGAFQKKYGARLVIMTGSLLASLGMGLSYLATQLWHLHVTYGCMIGLGYGLCVTPSYAILPEYFQKRRSFVISFASIGVAIGGALFAQLNMLLIETYTWRGSMLIQAGIALQVFVLGALCKSRIVYPEASLLSLLSWHMFKSVQFVLLLLDSVILGGVSITVFTMINSLVIGRGLSPWQSAQLVSVIGTGSAASRTLMTVLDHFKCASRTLTYAFMTLPLAIGVFGCVICFHYWAFAATLFIFGFSAGVKYSQAPNVIIEMFGAEKAVMGIGIFGLFLGKGDFLFPLVAGWVAEHTHIVFAFVLAAAAAIFGFGLCCVLICLRCLSCCVPNRAPPQDQNASIELKRLDEAVQQDLAER